MTNLVGQQLGNYRLIERLGSDGFADVYLGEHVLLKTKAAIKVLSSPGKQSDIENFHQEAQIIERLRHNSIVRFLEYGKHPSDDLFYLIMEYASKGSLRTLHPRHSIVPLKTIVIYVKQIANALQYIHNENLIHRDIKPENILVDDNDRVIISNFGLATIIQSATNGDTNHLVGTAAYMAPEQTQYPASDQYSLAVTVYEWLCGEPPFTEGNSVQLRYQHQHKAPIPLKERGVALSERVEKVVMKGLAKDPTQRYEIIQQFADALEQAANTPEGFRLIHTLKGVHVYSLAISPDGKFLVSGGTDGTIYETIRIWDMQTWERVDDFKETLEFQRYATALIDEPVDTLTEHSLPIHSIAISPDGKFLVSGSEDKTIKVWKFPSGMLETTLTEHSSYVYGVTIAPDGHTFASAGSNDWTVNIWDMQTQKLLRSLRCSGIVTCVAISPDNKTLANNSVYKERIIQLWNYQTATLLHTLKGHTGSIQALAFTPDGDTLISASHDKTIKVWNRNTGGLLRTLEGHTGPVNTIAISPDGQILISGSGHWDNTIKVWDVQTGKLLQTLTGHSQPIESVAFSPDGQTFASGDWNGKILIWSKD